MVGGGDYAQCRERVLRLVDRYRDAISGYLSPHAVGVGDVRAVEGAQGSDVQRWCREGGEDSGAAGGSGARANVEGWNCVVGGLYQVPWGMFDGVSSWSHGVGSWSNGVGSWSDGVFFWRDGVGSWRCCGVVERWCAFVE